MHTTGLKMVDNQTNKSRHHLPSVLNNWPDTDYTFCIQNIYLLFCKFYIFLMILIDNVLSNKEINWLHDNVCICLLSIIYNLDVYVNLNLDWELLISKRIAYVSLQFLNSVILLIDNFISRYILIGCLVQFKNILKLTMGATW